jgi:hypothetical protein
MVTTDKQLNEAKVSENEWGTSKISKNLGE